MVSADELAREAVLPGTEGLAAVVGAFGDAVLAADGTLDRSRLRDVIFRDPQRREELEGLLHPIIWQMRRRWLDGRVAEGESLVVSEIPLLFETGREGDFDVVVFVDAPESVRLERIVNNRDVGVEEARRIIAAQMDPALKRASADHVVANAGSLAELNADADRVLALLRGTDGMPVSCE